MLTPKQKELVDRLMLLTNKNTIVWAKYIAPKMFIYIKDDIRYIVNIYITSDGNKNYSCISLTVNNDKGKKFESCIGCNDTECMENYKELLVLYNVIEKQFTINEDKEIEYLLASLPH